MKISEIMTSRSVKYCGCDTKLRKAAKLMKEGNCGALPVVDDKKKVLGIITDRDICLSMAKKHGKADAKRTVGQIMPKNIYTVKTTDKLSTAFHHMRTNKVGRLPVVDAQGKLKGIVSLHNFIANVLESETKSHGHVSPSSESLQKTMQAVNKRYAHNSLSRTGTPPKKQKK